MFKDIPTPQSSIKNKRQSLNINTINNSENKEKFGTLFSVS